MSEWLKASFYLSRSRRLSLPMHLYPSLPPLNTAAKGMREQCGSLLDSGSRGGSRKVGGASTWLQQESSQSALLFLLLCAHVYMCVHMHMQRGEKEEEEKCSIMGCLRTYGSLAVFLTAYRLMKQ